MRVIVPFAPDAPKTRLAGTLSVDERSAFARAMLDDVIGALDEMGLDPEVLSTGPVDVGFPVVRDDRALTPAVNAVLRETEGTTAVVMADLPLVTTGVLRRLFEAAGDVVLAPGRAGGTNALVVRHPAFQVNFHGTSFLDHLAVARDIGANTSVIDSHRLATDIDEADDFVEVLLHGDGNAREWLEENGFRIVVRDNHVTLTRDQE